MSVDRIFTAFKNNLLLPPHHRDDTFFIVYWVYYLLLLKTKTRDSLSVHGTSQSAPRVSVVAQSCPATPDHQERSTGQQKQPRRLRGDTHLLVEPGRTAWLEMELFSRRQAYAHSALAREWVMVARPASTGHVRRALQQSRLCAPSSGP